MHALHYWVRELRSKEKDLISSQSQKIVSFRSGGGSICSHLECREKMFSRNFDISFDLALTLFLILILILIPSSKNQSIDLHRKSFDWFVYEGKTGF